MVVGARIVEVGRRGRDQGRVARVQPRGGVVGVDRTGGDVRGVRDAAREDGHRAPHVARAAGDVNEGVEVPVGERREAGGVVAIDADQGGGVGGRPGGAARGAGHRVARGDRVARHGPAEERRAAEYEQPHR